MEAVVKLLEFAEMLLRYRLARDIDSEEAPKLMRAMADVDNALANLQGGAA